MAATMTTVWPVLTAVLLTETVELRLLHAADVAPTKVVAAESHSFQQEHEHARRGRRIEQGRTMRISRPSNKQRLLDALNHRFTGEVPFLECYVADNIVDRVMGRPMGGKHMLQLEVADYVEFLQRAGMDAAYLYKGWFLGRRNKIDENGRVHYIDGTIKSRADFDQIVPPSLDPVRRYIEGFLEASCNTELGCIFSPDESCSMAFTAIGMTDYMLALHDEPDLIEEFMDRVEQYTLPLVEMAVEYPIDAIMMTSALCSKDGPMFSQEMHERFIFPRVQKVLDIIQPHKIPIIYHVDGDGSAFLDRLLEMRAAGLHPIEPNIKRFDILDLKRNYGDKLCLWGNIDVAGVLSCGTPDQVRQKTLEHLERLSPGGGYICGSSHDMGENVPFENFKAMAETVCSYISRG